MEADSTTTTGEFEVRVQLLTKLPFYPILTYNKLLFTRISEESSTTDVKLVLI